MIWWRLTKMRLSWCQCFEQQMSQRNFVLRFGSERWVGQIFCEWHNYKSRWNSFYQNLNVLDNESKSHDLISEPRIWRHSELSMSHLIHPGQNIFSLKSWLSKINFNKHHLFYCFQNVKVVNIYSVHPCTTIPWQSKELYNQMLKEN